MIHLVTVTHPKYHRELSACVKTFRKHNRSKFPWLFITEEQNVAAVKEIIPGETVVSMRHIDPRLEEIESGYCRQNAAKVLSIKELIGNPLVVFTDDDVTAEKKWKEATFLDMNDKAVVWFETNDSYPWIFRQQDVFGEWCNRLFQLRLPMVAYAGTLRWIAASLYTKRAMELWNAGAVGMSEFQLIGECCYRGAGQEALKNRDRNKGHWTLDRHIFRDWQQDRRKLLEALDRGEY